MEKLYDCKNLSFNYPLGTQVVHALKDVSFSVNHKDFICISGPSGSGKSTLLNLLGLIEPLQQGEILFSQRKVSDLSHQEENHIRKYELGFVFQSFHLLPVLTAYENVEFFLIRQGVNKEERKTRVENALKAVKLWEHKEKRPLEMSGGQRQRVAIARALAKNPKVIIADEPTASVDQHTGHEIMEILRKLNHEDGVSIIVSSHDPRVIEMADRHIVLQDGQIHSDTKEA